MFRGSYSKRIYINKLNEEELTFLEDEVKSLKDLDDYSGQPQKSLVLK